MAKSKAAKIKRLEQMKPGLYRNIHLARLKGKKPKPAGAKGRPTAANFKAAARTAKKK